jgi:Transglycosylase SLT domain
MNWRPAVAMSLVGRGVAVKLGLGVAAAVAALAIVSLVLAGWWASTSAGASQPCGDAGGRVTPLADGSAPRQLVPLFEGAARRYRLGPRGPAILAAIASVESGFGQNMGPSSAGAVGWMQFMPATWASYGVDANGDGRRDPYTASDAIFAAARYLRASGAPDDWYQALFAYNHADWYVEKVLREAERFRAALPIGGAAKDPVTVCEPSIELAVGGVRRVAGAGRIVPIPGSPGEAIDSRILRDVLFLQRRFLFTITAGYDPTGHKAAGEHPLGLALDIVPGPQGSWEDIDRLARWAEPRQNAPRPPFRWVGYNGDADHGRGHHLHLSWDHSPTAPGQPPEWVLVLAAP